jgi:hypothetical protein
VRALAGLGRRLRKAGDPSYVDSPAFSRRAILLEPERDILTSAFLIPPANLRAAWLIKAVGTDRSQVPGGPMLSSFAVAVTLCFVAGLIIVVSLAARAEADGSIARVLYDAEHPEKTR